MLVVGPVALLSIPAPLPAIAAAAVVAGVGIGVFVVLWESALQRHIPRHTLARVSAYDALGSFAAIPIGLAIAGPVAEGIGPRPTLIGAAALTTAACRAALLTRSVRLDDAGLGAAPGVHKTDKSA